LGDEAQERALRRAEGVKSFIQGEVLGPRDLCVVLADGGWPLSDLSAAAAGQLSSQGVIVVPEPVDVVVLLTQTCDLQKTNSEARLCQLAPVIDRGENFAHEAQRGRRPGWAAVPWHSATGVVDLARITSVERSLIIGAASLGRPMTPGEQLHFTESLSRHFTRVALPDPVVDILAPFLKRMKEKYDRNSNEGRCISMIPTGGLRIEATPGLDDPAPALCLLIVLETSNLPRLADGLDLDQSNVDALIEQGHDTAAKAALDSANPIHCREGWTALAELWTQEVVNLIAETPQVSSLDVEVLSGDELTFNRLRNAPELDLAYLSTRQV
jgi:hypothetical protein